MIYDGVITKPPLNELYHYNHNHDPRNGQFTSGRGGSAYRVSSNKGNIAHVNKKITNYKTVKDLQNDNSLHIADFSYDGTASKKVTDKDLNVISNLKKYQPQIEKLYKNNDLLEEDVANKLNDISDEINKNLDSSIDFRYSGFGSNGLQFDSYNTDTDVSITIFVKNKKMHIELDDWS